MALAGSPDATLVARTRINPAKRQSDLTHLPHRQNVLNLHGKTVLAAVADPDE